jgi:hypothetical protein
MIDEMRKGLCIEKRELHRRPTGSAGAGTGEIGRIIGPDPECANPDRCGGNGKKLLHDILLDDGLLQ